MRKGRRGSGDDNFFSQKPPDDLGVWDAGDDDYVIPPRGWLLGNTFCRKFLSSLIADGGGGKTALRIAQLLSLATNRELTGERVFQRCRVLILSLEDDKDELRRRVYAAMKHYGIMRDEVRGWLFLAAPKGIRLAEANGSAAPTIGALDALLRQEISARRLDLVSMDPFVKLHGLEENSNNAIDFVCGLLTEIGIEHNCAMDFPHHTAKGRGVAGNADNGRGASAAKDAARLVYTLAYMTPDEAEGFQVSGRERRFLVRYDRAKVNIAPPSGKARWYRLVGEALGNATELYPMGDTVQTVEVWNPPDTWADTEPGVLNRILDLIDRGIEGGSRYSNAPRATGRAAWPLVVQLIPSKSERQAREIINTWVKNGLLVSRQYRDPESRKDVDGLYVDASRRPSETYKPPPN